MRAVPTRCTCGRKFTKAQGKALRGLRRKLPRRSGTVEISTPCGHVFTIASPS